MFLSLALCSPQSSATERALCEPATALDFNSPDWLIALLNSTAESLDCADHSHKPEETRHPSRTASRDHFTSRHVGAFSDLCDVSTK